MLLQLAESGAIEFSDPVAGYFPELGAVQGHMSRSNPTTLFQLATHTSGLDREPDGDAFDSGPVGDWEKVLIAAMPHTHYIREPGTEFYYSNIGYAVLGAALSRAAREPYTRYLHAHVFDPLKMNNTSFELDDRNSSRLAKGYMVSGAVIDSLAPRTQLNGRGFRVPSGGLFTTVDDLAKFMSFEMQLDSNSVLMKKNFEASLHRLIVMTDADHGYGAGFMLARLGSSIAFGHDGNMDGYQAQAFFVRKSRLGVIVLASSSGGKLDTSDIVRGALQNR
jgi:CubicO group peptidase (beta-lactamase class C family)